MQFIVTLFSVRSGHSIATPFFCAEYVGQKRNDTEIAIPKAGGMRHGNAITRSDHPPPKVKKKISNIAQTVAVYPSSRLTHSLQYDSESKADDFLLQIYK